MTDRVVTYEEFMEHQERENLWLLLHGKVYDVAKFLDEHPGGEEVIVAEAGKDATESFEDVGHSDEARDILKTLLVGTLDGTDIKQAPVPTNGGGTNPGIKHGNGGPPSMSTFLLPLAGLVAYFAWRYYGA